MFHNPLYRRYVMNNIYYIRAFTSTTLVLLITKIGLFVSPRCSHLQTGCVSHYLLNALRQRLLVIITNLLKGGPGGSLPAAAGSIKKNQGAFFLRDPSPGQTRAGPLVVSAGADAAMWRCSPESACLFLPSSPSLLIPFPPPVNITHMEAMRGEKRRARG